MADMIEFSVPFRVTLQGDVIVSAQSAAEAVALCQAGSWDDDTFYTRAEIVDWEVRGKAKEA